MTLGSIFNIQRFSINDGPGIRTTVFLKGCPLRCLWCHNPESQSKVAEISYDTKKCFSCGKCVDACQKKCHTNYGKHIFDRSNCIGCGACCAVCPSKALELYGRSVTDDEVMLEILRDKIFYETSGGGVTISGGEPLFQPEFSAQIIQMCKAHGIHTAIETCGFASENDLCSVVKFSDLVLFDIKETDEELHQKYTGAPLGPILRNLSLVNEMQIPFIIRAPLIPTLNDRENHINALMDIRSSMKYCQGIEIMPYHDIGVYKYDLLGKKYRCYDITAPDEKLLLDIKCRLC